MRKFFFAIFILAVMIATPNAGVQASPNGSRGFDCSSCHPGTPDQNPPPRANAGVDQTVRAGAVVTLDGSNSTDPNGSIASYAWTRTAGPAVADFKRCGRKTHLHSAVCRGKRDIHYL